MRAMTAAAQAQYKSSFIQPLLIGRLDILNDPVFGWNGYGFYAPTGTGDAALDGFMFEPMDAFIDMSDIQEDQGVGKPLNLTVAGHDLDEGLLRQVVRDKRSWLGRKAYIWAGLLNDEKTAVADPTRMKTGVMTSMEVRREAGQSIIAVSIDVDTRNVGAASFRILDHPRLVVGDTFSSYMIKLANKGARFTDRDINPIAPGGRFIGTGGVRL